VSPAVAWRWVVRVSRAQSTLVILHPGRQGFQASPVTTPEAHAWERCRCTQPENVPWLV